MLRPLSALLALALLTGCGDRRPAGVPAEARWVGPKDTGAWVRVGDRENGRWRVQAWGRDGAVVADGPYQLRGMARVSVEPHELAAWDGRQLALRDGTLLVPAP